MLSCCCYWIKIQVKDFLELEVSSWACWLMKVRADSAYVKCRSRMKIVPGRVLWRSWWWWCTHWTRVVGPPINPLSKWGVSSKSPWQRYSSTACCIILLLHDRYRRLVPYSSLGTTVTSSKKSKTVGRRNYRPEPLENLVKSVILAKKNRPPQLLTYLTRR